MIPQTKADLVRAALRKAAIASDTTLTDIDPQAMQDGLTDLELMIAEWAGPDGIIITGYNYTIGAETPGDVDPEQPHGLADWMINGVVLSLAIRMLTDFKSEPAQNLVTKAGYAKQQIVNYSRNRMRRSRHRSRTPVGSGNRGLNGLGFRYFPSRRDGEDDY